MKTCLSIAIGIILFLGPVGGAFPQQGTAPLTEREITYLLQKKVSNAALAEMVGSYGVAFGPDEAIYKRLKAAGANESLMVIIRKQAKARELRIEVIKPEPPAPPPDPIPAPAREHLQLGQQKVKSLDFAGALGEYAEAERIRPQWDQVFRYRGLLFEAQGRYLDAAAQWKQYLALAPPDTNKIAIQKKISDWEAEASTRSQVRALLAQGDRQLQSGDSKGAAEAFRSAIALDTSLGALLALARVQLFDRDFPGLAITARQAQALDRQSALAALYQADADLRQGNPAPASLQQGTSSNPNLAYGRSLIARELRLKAQQAGKGKPTASDAASAASADERNRRAWALWNGGSFRAALAEMQYATQLNPSDEGLQCDLAYARLAQRDSAGAAAAAREAIRLNPESACGHHAFGLSLEKMGQPDKALQELQAAEKLTSDLGLAGLLRPGMNPGSN
jgi:hypothetical protein